MSATITRPQAEAIRTALMPAASDGVREGSPLFERYVITARANTLAVLVRLELAEVVTEVVGIDREEITSHVLTLAGELVRADLRNGADLPRLDSLRYLVRRAVRPTTDAYEGYALAEVDGAWHVVPERGGVPLSLDPYDSADKAIDALRCTVNGQHFGDIRWEVLTKEANADIRDALGADLISMADYARAEEYRQAHAATFWTEDGRTLRPEVDADAFNSAEQNAWDTAHELGFADYSARWYQVFNSTYAMMRDENAAQREREAYYAQQDAEAAEEAAPAPVDHRRCEHRKNVTADHATDCPVYDEGATAERCNCHYSDARCEAAQAAQAAEEAAPAPASVYVTTEAGERIEYAHVPNGDRARVAHFLDAARAVPTFRDVSTTR
ncbi:hypothetical protein [Streptomyces sp. NPDC059468]|uniref:hypothetical protein n=1 Tax=Streptomyces sp. NPDC059468 TaxID=3346845 RepID=UPI0036BFA594